MKYHLTLAILANIKKFDNIQHRRVFGKTSIFIDFARNVNVNFLEFYIMRNLNAQSK